MAVHRDIARALFRRARRRERQAEESRVRTRQGERRDPERDDRDSFFRWSEQERKGPAEHRIDNDRIHRELAADVAYPGALIRHCIGEEVFQSEAELIGARCELAAFGKMIVESPIVDVDFRPERDESRTGRLHSLPEHAPSMHDDLVAATDEVLGNGQQGEDVTGYRGGGDEKACHIVLSLSLSLTLTLTPLTCSLLVH